MSLDVSTFHQLKNGDIPMSEHHRNLQELSVSPIEMFVRYLVTEDPVYVDADSILLSSSELLNKFKDFGALYNIKYEVNAISLGVRLKHLNISGVETGIHTKTGKKCSFIIKEICKHFGFEHTKLTL